MKTIARSLFIFTFALMTFAPTHHASATMSLVGLVPVDNSSVPALAGYRTYDLVVNTTGDWTAAAMLLELTNGSMYQDPFGSPSGLSPNVALLDVAGFETLRFDTFVTNPDGSEVGGGAGIAGGAGDVGGDGFEFSTTELDVSWYSPGPDKNDMGDSMIARITFSKDAVGTLKLAITEAFTADLIEFELSTSPEYQISFTPEPGTLALLGTGGLMLLRRRM